MLQMGYVKERAFSASMVGSARKETPFFAASFGIQAVFDDGNQSETARQFVASGTHICV